MSNEQKIVVVGIGFFEEQLLQSISAEWPILAIELDRERIRELKEKVGNAEYVRGDATSRMTWEGLDPKEVRSIIVAVRDPKMSVEVCRIVREHFSETVSMMVVDYTSENGRDYSGLDVKLIRPLEIAIQVIRNLLHRNYSQAINIGLGKGELLEINVLAGSHLVDRKLKYLRPSRWAVSAIYRDGELIVPTGNCVMKVGDRVVLVGDPKVLENVAAILIKGVPQFPLQYGPELVVPLHQEYSGMLREARYWLEKSRASRLQLVPFRRRLSDDLIAEVKAHEQPFRVGRGVDVFRDIFPVETEAGMVMLPPSGFWERSRVQTAFSQCRVPVLIARDGAPYKRIVVSLNNHEPAHALETAGELARLMDIPYEALFVTFPKELRGREEEEALKLRQHTVEDFEAIFHQEIPYRVEEGNPVKATLGFLERFDGSLLVTVSRRSESTGLFNRNVPYRIVRGTKLSTLVLPGVTDDA